MIRLYLIRHGQTPGNKLQRYIGTTDEPLSTEGKEFLEKLTYPMPEALYENKNYKELSGNQDYQRWIDSNGTLPFPGGESREAFKYRSLTGFQKAVTQCIRNNIKTAALVIHGGTIMNIMEEYADRPRAFYEWHVKNGGGYLAELEPALWQKGRRELCVREAYMEG